jgi:hypothetical protein
MLLLLLLLVVVRCMVAVLLLMLLAVASVLHQLLLNLRRILRRHAILIPASSHANLCCRVLPDARVGIAGCSSSNSSCCACTLPRQAVDAAALAHAAPALLLLLRVAIPAMHGHASCCSWIQHRICCCSAIL